MPTPHPGTLPPLADAEAQFMNDCPLSWFFQQGFSIVGNIFDNGRLFSRSRSIREAIHDFHFIAPDGNIAGLIISLAINCNQIGNHNPWFSSREKLFRQCEFA